MDKETVRVIIDKLLIIQERDCHIARCQRELSDIPNLKQNIETKLNQHKAALEKSKVTIKTRLAAVKEMEIEIETFRQQIAKLREQQFQIKSNEEFKVLNREIAALQEKIRGLEDTEIELMETVEQAQREENGLKLESAKAEGTVQSEIKQLDDRRKSLESELQQLQTNRQGLVVGIAENWLARYNLVMENRKDVALVGLDGNACGGCHMKLPPHVLQDIKRANAIITCSFCGRLLYWHT
ncbi:MAG: C4-type zinc ribbon domain-containing protein [Kiritimatiellae bacterium]|nr:C4-type zinc ribbon domain-containing protein [Kiritimatiellia bacterium]